MLLSHTQIMYLSCFFVDYMCSLWENTKLYNMFFCLSVLYIQSAVTKHLIRQTLST